MFAITFPLSLSLMFSCKLNANVLTDYHDKVVRTLDTMVGGRVVGGYAARVDAGIQKMKQFAHNWYLPCCEYTGHVPMSSP